METLKAIAATVALLLCLLLLSRFIDGVLSFLVRNWWLPAGVAAVFLLSRLSRKRA